MNLENILKKVKLDKIVLMDIIVEEHLSKNFKRKTKKINVNLNGLAARDLQKISKLLKVSINSVIVGLLQDYIRQEENK